MKEHKNNKNAEFAKLIAEISAGDVAKFNDLLNQITPIMFKYFYRMGASQETAEDLTQNVAIKLWRYLDRFDEKKSKFTSWLYMICIQTWSDTYKIDKKNTSIAETLKTDLQQVNETKNIENRNQIRVAMNGLVEKQRAILILTYYHGLTNKECASVLKTTEKAIERHLSKARKSMKEFLTKR